MWSKRGLWSGAGKAGFNGSLEISCDTRVATLNKGTGCGTQTPSRGVVCRGEEQKSSSYLTLEKNGVQV